MGGVTKDPNPKTLKVSSVDGCHVKRERLVYRVTRQSRKPLGFKVYIETERAIVHGNRELIRLYEEKVKKVIKRVWEG
ncbi:MAG: hypothetical protein C4583_19055 [Anaerolineaceae bacterium]|nr:MAG: hypothetical protein C4583_19055 [Anaerolineaceae bacterium]